ncbi:MAG: hypothetical protein ACR65O_08830 [Methylomicrobium sp.]
MPTSTLGWRKARTRKLCAKTWELDNLSQPAKALFAGDKAQYDQAFEQYKTNRRQEILKCVYFMRRLCAAGHHCRD